MQGRVAYCRDIRASTCIRIANKCVATQGRVTYLRELSACDLQTIALHYKAVFHTSVA